MNILTGGDEMNDEKSTLDFSAHLAERASVFVQEEVLGEVIKASRDYYFWVKQTPSFDSLNHFSEYNFGESIIERLNQFKEDLAREALVDDFNSFNLNKALKNLASPHEPRQKDIANLEIFEGSEEEFIESFFANLSRAHMTIIGYLSALYYESSAIVRACETHQTVRGDTLTQEMNIWETTKLLNTPVTRVLEGIARDVAIDELARESFESFEELLSFVESIQLNEEQLQSIALEHPEYPHEKIIDALRRAFDELTVMIHLELSS